MTAQHKAPAIMAGDYTDTEEYLDVILLCSLNSLGSLRFIVCRE
jgi:hypothetical protein